MTDVLVVDSVQRQGETFLRLLGYQRSGPAYGVLPPDEQGRLWIDPVRIWLGIQDNEVYCYDATGTPLGDYGDVVALLAAERQARNTAEARLRELAAEVQRLRG